MKTGPRYSSLMRELQFCFSILVAVIMLYPPDSVAFSDRVQSVSVLFVANMNDAVEKDIYEHILEFNTSDRFDFYHVTVARDDEVRWRTDLKKFDLIILSGYSPGLRPGGLFNIWISKKPTLIIETPRSPYARKLGLARASGWFPVDENRIVPADPQHPVTDVFKQGDKVYSSDRALMWAIHPDYLRRNTVPLLNLPDSPNDPESYAVAIVNEKKRIIATGIYDTTFYTDRGWMLFDQALAYLHPFDLRHDGLGPVNRAFIDSNVMEMLRRIQQNPNGWRYEDAVRAVWPVLHVSGLSFMSRDVLDLIDMMYKGPGYVPDLHTYTNSEGEQLLDIALYHPSMVTECEAWYDEMIADADQLFPDAISQDRYESGGVPVLDFDMSGGQWDTVFTENTRDFAVSLLTFWGPQYCDSESDCMYPLILRWNAGTSALTNVDDLYEDDDALGQYWWGRYTGSNYFHPMPVYRFPYEIITRSNHWTNDYIILGTSILLDVYKYPDGEPKRRNNPECFVRFFNIPPGGEDENLLPFEAGEMPSDIPFSGIDDYCEYDEPFNPFATGDGLPNTFMDAVYGESQDSPDDLLPRMQLVWPGNHFMDREHLIERYCEKDDTTKAVCSNVSANVDNFMAGVGLDDFGTHADEYYSPEGRIFPRYRDETLEVSWSNDRGIWQAPRMKAGYKSQVLVMIRRESDALVEDASGAFCDIAEIEDAASSGEMKYNIAYLKYQTKSEPGVWVEPDPALLDDIRQNGMLVDEYPDIPVIMMPCYPLAQTTAEASPYDIDIESGITYLSGALTTADTYTPSTIRVPDDAAGEARLVFLGSVINRTTYFLLDFDEVDRNIRREFPVSIDPIEDDVETSFELESKPACWIGSTRRFTPAIELPIYPATLYGYSTVPTAFDFSTPYHDWVKTWLMGGDEGPWIKRVKKSGGVTVDERLYSLFGDIGIDWSGAGFSWFEYRGSGMANYQPLVIDGSVTPPEYQWMEGFDGTQCPVMGVETLGDDLTPWGITRAKGFNSENATYHTGSPDYIDTCIETDAETVAAVTGFQFEDQESSGQVNVWFGVATDWGGRFAPGTDMGGTSGNIFRDDLTGFDLSTYLFNYDTALTPPWNSFLAVWDFDYGIDDLGRSVSWNSYYDPVEDEYMATTFLINAAVKEDDMYDALNGSYGHLPVEAGITASPPVEGILVWHSGRYRNSGVYLSFAKRVDVMYPEQYWHFAGYDGDLPVWSQNEYEARPVIWDDVGELSAVHIQDNVFDGEFKVLYNINANGQEGIVMRHAQDPWGPYSDIVPLFDCKGAADELAPDGVFIKWPNFKYAEKEFSSGGKRCYGGFTHPDFWEIGPDETTFRFNVSMAAPYKVLFVETTATNMP